MSGISRSTSMVIAYLIKEKGMGFEEAFAFCKEKRPIVHPNSGFKKQLRELEE
jgi:protein-tyrosine phosphatase